MPTPTSLQWDGRLSNIAIQYQNPEFIGDLVVPPTPVMQKTGKFKKYNKEERFTLPDTKVGHATKPGEVNWHVTEDTYTCDDFGLEQFLSEEEVANAEAPINAQGATVDYLMSLISLAKEKRFADAIFNANNYATANKIDIAGAWATLSTDALSQIEVGIDACFMPPNVMVMGIETWRKLARNEKVLAAVKGTLAPQSVKSGGTALPAVNQQELATYLGLDAVLVGRARINTAVEGQTATFARVWDGTNATKGGAALLRVKKGGGLNDVVWGANFEWKNRQVMTSITDRGAFGGQMIRVVESNVMKIVATDVGYLFQDCLVT